MHVNLHREPQSAELEQLALALDAVALANQIAGEKKVELASFNALELLRFAGSKNSASGPEAAPDELVPSVVAVVEELVAMRRAEGEALGSVLATLAQELEQEVAAIEAELPSEDARLLGRAREHLATLFGEREASDPESEARFQERLVSEVALLIHKGDIAEELARIASHLGQWHEVLAAPAKVGQGKTLDFLCQELFREVNTIGSKV
ncbi:MAG: endoribonuclease YicC domain-containing protein, partial [Nannocystaceae bacterium]